MPILFYKPHFSGDLAKDTNSNLASPTYNKGLGQSESTIDITTSGHQILTE
jgi:hypothetical protein